MKELLVNNVNKIIIGIMAIAIAIVFLLFLISFSTNSQTAKVNNHTFKLYVAKKSNDLQIGLSKYKKIQDDQGMVFIFDKTDFYPFWMKGMKFPIDIIYIKDDTVVNDFQNAQPGDQKIYYPTHPANKVLEINAGLSQKYGISEGSKIKFSNL